MIQRRDPIDESTAALLREGTVRRRRDMTPGKRRKLQRDEGRSKATYDLPKAITKRIAQIAEQERCPQSGVVAVFLVEGIRRYEDQEIDLAQWKSPSDSPKFDHVIEISDEELP